MPVEAGLGDDNSIRAGHGGDSNEVPVARSDPRRATIIGIVGVIVGTLLIVLVLFAGNLGGGDKVQKSKTSFDVGRASDMAGSIAADGPIAFNDPVNGSRPIFIQHSGTDERSGWVAFEATNGSCALEWHNDTRDFTCGTRRVPADGDGSEFRHYPATVDDNGHVIVDLSLDATTSNSP